MCWASWFTDSMWSAIMSPEPAIRIWPGLLPGWSARLSEAREPLCLGVLALASTSQTSRLERRFVLLRHGRRVITHRNAGLPEAVAQSKAPEVFDSGLGSHLTSAPASAGAFTGDASTLL
ncbi:hypothetical protein GCM10008955_14860 [Deinococcus malanensis]|uniref:Uncharacterized protein n=1 Tax=Deinococcus malanensis TaxID=1706855 RepID=A0ABQ2ERK9_9DEIO|nr:hypothetical protein GCM10008955_14860 [Deinococcus malanensis]